MSLRFLTISPRFHALSERASRLISLFAACRLSHRFHTLPLEGQPTPGYHQKRLPWSSLFSLSRVISSERRAAPSFHSSLFSLLLSLFTSQPSKDTREKKKEKSGKGHNSRSFFLLSCSFISSFLHTCCLTICSIFPFRFFFRGKRRASSYIFSSPILSLVTFYSAERERERQNSSG